MGLRKIVAIKKAILYLPLENLPLINSEQRVGAQLNDSGVEVDALSEPQRRGVPLVQARREQHRLPPVEGQSNLALLHL